MIELYRSMGLSIIPCHYMDKRPAVKWQEFQKRYATDDEISRWFGTDKKYNIAIITGSISKLLVLDCDSEQSINEAELRGLPETPCCKTAKGRHYYFYYEDNDIKNAVKIGAGFDIRAEGGYVLAPNSTHPLGAIYEWIVSPSDCGFAPPPQWLIDVCKHKNKHIDKLLSDLTTAPVGKRNDELNKAAFRFGQLITNKIVLDSDLNKLYDTAIAIGLEALETQQTIRSGVMAGKANASGLIINEDEEIIDVCTFERYTYLDLKRYAPNPKDNIAGNGFLRRRASCVLTGSTGIGKSVLSEQIACCLAAGINIVSDHGSGGIVVHRPVKVLYIQAENDAETLKRDIMSICGPNGLSVDEDILNKNLVFWTHYGDKPERFGVWLREKVEAESPDVLILDPYDSYCGERDKNSSESFFRFRNVIQPIVNQYFLALLLVTHTTKPKGNELYTARDSVYMSAGTSTLANWARTSCELTNPDIDQDERYRLRFGKNCERLGLCDFDGSLLRDVYLEHSGDREHPFWVSSEDQHEHNKEYNETFRDAVIRLWENNHDASQKMIAHELEKNQGSVSRVLNSYKPYIAYINFTKSRG